MRSDVEHHDPARVARRAAVRSAAERDPAVRAAERAMSPAERLRAGFALSRTASRMRAAHRS